MRRWLRRLRLRTLLGLLLLYNLLLIPLALIPFVPNHIFVLPVLAAVNLLFLLVLPFPRLRPWGLHMLANSLALLLLCTLYALFPGIPTSTHSTVKLVGYEGGLLLTPDLQSALVAYPYSTLLPLGVRVASLPLDQPPPGPAIAPEVRPVAAARFQARPNLFFFPVLALSLKHAVAPLEGGDYLTEFCLWVPPEVSDRVYGEWYCFDYFDVLLGDPAQKGSGWAARVVKGFPKEGLLAYVFQYPRDWARQNCEAAGGRFYTTGYGSVCSYVDDDERTYDFGQVFQNPLKKRPAGGSLEIGTIPLSGDGRLQLRTLTWNVGHTPPDCFFKLCDDEYLRKTAQQLREIDPDIVHLQEVYVEETRCNTHPNEPPCQDDEPLIEEILSKWKGPNWRDELDYVCKMYECTIIKKRTASGLELEFVDKTNPTYTDYVTGVEGQDTGYLYALLRVRHPDGEEQYLATFNEHTATPADPRNADVRAKQFEKQREHILRLLSSEATAQQVVGDPFPATKPIQVAECDPVTRRGCYGPRPRRSGSAPIPILKMGDFNLHLAPPEGNPLTREYLPEPDDKAITRLIALVDPNAAPGAIFDGSDTAETAFGEEGPLLWRVGVDDYVSTYGFDLNTFFTKKTTDIVATNYFVGACGISKDLASLPWDGFDHNPVTCALKPVKTRRFTGAAVRGNTTLRYAGGRLGPAVRVGTLFPNKSYGYRCRGRYCGTFFDLFASFPPTFHDDGTFTVEVPEHLLEAGLPVWVRYCVPTLGCKFVKLDPNNPEFTIPFNDDCDDGGP